MAEGGPNPPDTVLETQKNEIATLMKKPLCKGDTWYLIDHRWFKQWKKYVGYDTWDTTSVGEQSSHPGPIDNGPLFKDETCSEIKEHLIDELDYVLVPQDVWDIISKSYNLMEAQQPIARKVVEYGMFVKHCKVEVYLMDFKLCQNNDLDNCVTKKFSKADTIDQIQQEMRKIFNIPEGKETRLWNRYTTTAYELLNKLDTTVQDVGLHAGQFLVIEQRNDDGTWPRQAKNTNSSSMSYSNSNSGGGGNATGGAAGEGKQYGGSTNSISTRYGSVSGGGYGGGYSSYSYIEGGMGNVQPGLCGLCNVGNTCFMNSALQCMSNCPPLMHYFMEERYFSELNTENPLGMRGEIAKAFGDLIKIMWSGRYQYTSPRNFKMQVGRFAPQFSGYQQQDSQELMAFLLDGLHEDLNRIKRKPYIELKDADARPDEEVAREAWENYRKRNDSIIVDIFHGLLKSTLVCPECSKVSVTFDPFCYLSLPLPMKKERQIEVFFIALDPFKKPVQYKVTVPKMGNVTDLCTALSRFTGIPPTQMMVTDVYNHRFHKVFQTEDGLNNILDRDDIFVYEIPAPSDETDLVVPVYMREKKVRPGYNNYSTGSVQLFGQPLLIPVSRKHCTYNLLYELILQKMQRYVNMPEADDEWWVEPDNTDGVNGEVEMTNGDDDYDDSDSPVDEEGKPMDGNGEQIDVSKGVKETNGVKAKPKLFTMHIVNSYGNTDVDTIEDNEKPLKLSSKSYVAIDWHPRAKEKLFDEKQAEIMEQHDSVHQRPSQKKQVIQLNECLELFTATEKLSAEDSWYCPQCKEHQQATKKFDLWSLPQVLVLYFKRFSYNRYWRDKIDTLVEFPSSELDMSKYILFSDQKDPVIYDLIGVSNHYGGMGGGHYTAYCRNKDDGSWYHFDDTSVSQINEESVVSKAAYVLFYIRRDTNTQTNASSPPNNNAAATSTAPDGEDSDMASSEEDPPMDTN